MNHSKKIKGKKQVNVQTVMPKKKLWMIPSIIIIIALMGIVAYEQIYQNFIISINGDRYYQRDLNYYIYQVESSYDYYNQMLGGSNWDKTLDENNGTTMRQYAKQEAIETSYSTEILYREAINKGYSLTADEKKTIATNVTDKLKSLSSALKKKNHFTKSYLTKIMGRTTLADRYRQDVIDSFDIDDAKIKEGVDKDKYRQYDIEYLFISTQTTDADGNPTNVSDSDKKAASDKINALYDKALDTQDWSKLIPDDEKELTYQKDNFLESDTKFSDDFKAMMTKMNNKDVSKVYEAENGYYLVRMINNNSSESYDNAVKQAITDAENEAFSKEYTNIKAKYNCKTNEKEWNKLTMGSITLGV